MDNFSILAAVKSWHQQKPLKAVFLYIGYWSKIHRTKAGQLQSMVQRDFPRSGEVILSDLAAILQTSVLLFLIGNGKKVEFGCLKKRYIVACKTGKKQAKSK